MKLDRIEGVGNAGTLACSWFSALLLKTTISISTFRPLRCVTLIDSGNVSGQKLIILMSFLKNYIIHFSEKLLNVFAEIYVFAELMSLLCYVFAEID